MRLCGHSRLHTIVRPQNTFAPTAVLIYDGHCRFCLAQAQRLRRWSRSRVRLESFRDPEVLARYPGLTPERCERAVQLVESDGRAYSGAEAIAHTLRLNPVLAPLSWLYYVPGLRQMLDAAYAAVARNRFRLRAADCGDGSCELHRVPIESEPRTGPEG